MFWSISQWRPRPSPANHVFFDMWPVPVHSHIPRNLEHNYSVGSRESSPGIVLGPTLEIWSNRFQTFASKNSHLKSCGNSMWRSHERGLSLGGGWRMEIKPSQIMVDSIFPWWLSGKEFRCQCRRRRFDPWVRKTLWRRKWQPTPVFLLGKSHGQRKLAGYSPRGCKELDTIEQLNHNITGLQGMHFPSTISMCLCLQLLVTASDSREAKSHGGVLASDILMEWSQEKSVRGGGEE